MIGNTSSGILYQMRDIYICRKVSFLIINFEPTIYRIRDEHANHYTTNAFNIMMKNKVPNEIGKLNKISRLQCHEVSSQM